MMSNEAAIRLAEALEKLALAIERATPPSLMDRLQVHGHNPYPYPQPPIWNPPWPSTTCGADLVNTTGCSHSGAPSRIR